MVVQKENPVEVKRVDLLVVAGEPSGDQHAAICVRELKKRHPQWSICATGGPALEAAGAHLFINMMPFSAVGLMEVVSHYSRWKQLLRWLVEWVRVYQPKMVCLVDFPGFNLRFAKALYREHLSQKGGGSVKILGYIAPQIWAWKARRRFSMARWLDALAVIFPFEPAGFADTNLPVYFVGHPLLQQPNLFRYDPQGALLLLPGSRKSAVIRIFPLLQEGFQQLRKQHPSLQAVVPFPNEAVGAYLKAQAGDGITICSVSDVSVGFCGAVMSSGTASLQVALAGIPGVVTYRANPITFFCGKRLVKVPYLSMANLLLQREAFPEILQNTPSQATAIARQMNLFLSDPEPARARFLEDAHRLTELLSVPTQQSLLDVIDTMMDECFFGLESKGE